eukprot:754085-Hanusia_phi.AAC.3
MMIELIRPDNFVSETKAFVMMSAADTEIELSEMSNTTSALSFCRRTMTSLASFDPSVTPRSFRTWFASNSSELLSSCFSVLLLPVR